MKPLRSHTLATQAADPGVPSARDTANGLRQLAVLLLDIPFDGAPAAAHDIRGRIPEASTGAAG